MTTVETWLQRHTKRLEDADIPTARLDCLVLLEDATGKDRAWLLAHPEYKIDAKTLARLRKQIVRRSTHEPLAYIRSKTEFYGREFYVDHRVLEPRPESETMIDLLKGLPLPAQPFIIDVGTGSGALAITAKLELPHARVAGTDIDAGCLAVAERNARSLQAAIILHEADLLPSSDLALQSPTVILANLPYVPDSFQINPAAMQEPRLAIFGGPDGLDLYRRLFAVLPSTAGFVLTEALPPQHARLTEIAAQYDYQQLEADDFIQIFVRGD